MISYRFCYPLALGPQGLSKRWLLRSRVSESLRLDSAQSSLLILTLSAIGATLCKCLSHPYTVPCTHPYCVLFGPLLPFLPSPPLLHFKLLGPFCLHSFFHLSKSPRCDRQTDPLIHRLDHTFPLARRSRERPHRLHWQSHRAAVIHPLGSAQHAPTHPRGQTWSYGIWSCSGPFLLFSYSSVWNEGWFI